MGCRNEGTEDVEVVAMAEGRADMHLVLEGNVFVHSVAIGFHT